MMFFGDFFCGNVMSATCTPTDIDNITRVELSDGWYDDLRITKNVTEELSSSVKQDWDWDTILHAKFDDTTSAGNVLWTFDSVSHLLIKRKKINEFKWITLEVHKIEKIEDFNIRNTDVTAIPNIEYQYAAVPIENGVEGFYSIDNVMVKSECLVIVDRDELWCTNITDNYLDNTSVVPNSVVQTMYEKYPTVIRNSAANYEEITVNAQFFPTSEDGCDIEWEDDAKRIEYNNKAKMFLRNENAKILKSIDGNCWGVYVTTPPSDTATDDYKNRKLSFTCTEIFNIEDEESLWENGLINESASEEWWNR